MIIQARSLSSKFPNNSLSLLSTHCEWLKHDKNEKVTLQCRRILESYMPCCSWGSCSSSVPLIFYIYIYIFAEIYASGQPSHSQVGFINYDCFHFGARGYNFSLYWIMSRGAQIIFINGRFLWWVKTETLIIENKYWVLDFCSYLENQLNG